MTKFVDLLVTFYFEIGFRKILRAFLLSTVRAFTMDNLWQDDQLTGQLVR